MAHVSLYPSLLDRRASLSGLSPLQGEVDALVGASLRQATDWQALAAMTMGAAAYRTARLGVMGLASGNALCAASIGLGLGAEVSAFELMHRGLSTVSGSNPKLWKWSGPGGLRQGLFHSFLSFGALKGAGRVARGENLPVQHLLQDTAMVAGHQISGALGLTPRPRGTLAEQFLHAEATNLQIGAGLALLHGMVPALHSMERGLDLSIRSTPSPSSLALEGEGDWRPGEGVLTRHYQPSLTLRRPVPQDLWMMGSSDDPKGKGPSGIKGFLSLGGILSRLVSSESDMEKHAREAEKNPRRALSLNRLALSGFADARLAVRSLKVETLALLAQKDPEAVEALRVIGLSGNPAARSSLKDLDVSFLAEKAGRDSRFLTALRASVGWGASINMGAFAALQALAPKNPEAVAALYTLSVAGSEPASRFLKTLDPSELRRQALEDSYAFLALGFLAREGNPAALPALAQAAKTQGMEVDILQNLAEEQFPGALKALEAAAETNHRGGKALADLVAAELPEALHSLERAAGKSIVAAEMLLGLAERNSPGAAEALWRAGDRSAQALSLFYSLTSSENRSISHRALRILMSGKEETPPLSQKLTQTLQTLKEAETLTALRKGLDELRRLGEQDPEAVFILNDWAWNRERPLAASLAQFRLRSMEVDSLVLQAPWNPAAVMALAYMADFRNREAEMALLNLKPDFLGGTPNKSALMALHLLAEAGNPVAWESFLIADPKTFGLESPLSSSSLFTLFLFARSENPLSLWILAREAKTDPRAVFVLRDLVSKAGLPQAEEILLSLPLNHLAETARTQPEAVEALSQLGQLGNPAVRPLLRSLDVSAHAVRASETTSLNALLTLSAFGNKGARDFLKDHLNK